MKSEITGPTLNALILLIAVAGFVLADAGCNKTTDSRQYSLSGTVTDSLTKAPIDSAWVIMFDTTAVSPRYTDTLGHYSLGGIGGDNNVPLFVGRSGYRTKTRMIPQLVDGITGVDFELVPVQ